MIDAVSWLEGEIEEALREIAGRSSSHASFLLDRLETQAAALLAVGALAPDANPVLEVRGILAERGLASGGAPGVVPARPRWVEIHDNPTPTPQLLSVVPVGWRPPVLPRGDLWIVALWLWTDHARLTWAAVGSHGAWDRMARTKFVLVDDQGTTYESGEGGRGQWGGRPITVKGYTVFRPSLPAAATSVTLTVRRGRFSTRRGITITPRS